MIGFSGKSLSTHESIIWSITIKKVMCNSRLYPLMFRCYHILNTWFCACARIGTDMRSVQSSHAKRRTSFCTLQLFKSSNISKIEFGVLYKPRPDSTTGDIVLTKSYVLIQTLRNLQPRFSLYKRDDLLLNKIDEDHEEDIATTPDDTST